MKLSEVVENLCEHSPVTVDTVTKSYEPDEDCTCDNCVSGRHRLADYIIELIVGFAPV